MGNQNVAGESGCSLLGPIQYRHRTSSHSGPPSFDTP